MTGFIGTAVHGEGCWLQAVYAAATSNASRPAFSCDEAAMSANRAQLPRAIVFALPQFTLAHRLIVEQNRPLPCRSGRRCGNLRKCRVRGCPEGPCTWCIGSGSR